MFQVELNHQTSRRLAMVLIREPEPAIVSLKALRIQLNRRQNPRAYPMDILIQKYIDFYQPLFSLKEGFLVVKFEEATNNFQGVMREFNRKFGTDFKAIEHSKENETAIFSRSGVHLSPSLERELLKTELQDEIAALRDSETMLEAKRIHAEFSAL